jgi:uncharacterized protein (TIGR03790 family)
MIRFRTSFAALAAVILVGVASGRDALAQSAENVALVINENSAASQVVGEHYARKRAIPATNVIRIHAPTDETIDRTVYRATIEAPIASALAHNGLQDRVLYIVLTKGVPLRIAGTVGQEGTMASVDSELTLLYRKMVGLPVAAVGPIQNPYFLGRGTVREAHRFSHRDHDIYLVTRLDAFTVEEATMLVDTAMSAVSDGQIVLDERGALVTRTGEDWLEEAAQTLRSSGGAERVVLETTPKPAAVSGPVLGYFAWGSTDPQLRKRAVGMQFAPGAIAGTFAGADARTFQPPPQAWVPMKDPSNRSTWFGGGPQSLVGDLIREGVTGIAGNVAEPFLQGVIRPNVLFPAYLAGFNLAEAFYLSTPYLSWQTVIIGDPLCEPFMQKPLAKADSEPATDQATELPAFFSERRLRVATAAMKLDPKLTALLVRAGTRLEKDDRAGGRALLAEVTNAAPKLAAAHLQLAMLDDGSGDHEAAIAGYRRVLELQPDNVVALNNLAFSLAVYKNSPAEGRPLALRAVNLSKRNPDIIDTLAWVEHLLGEEVSARTLLVEAARAAPGNADVRMHAAIVAAAIGDLPGAEAHLKEALRRNPALEKNADVIALRERLSRATATP